MKSVIKVPNDSIHFMYNIYLNIKYQVYLYTYNNKTTKPDPIIPLRIK